MMQISVIIPTYCRPKDLVRCLEGLKKQTRPPDEVLVIVRDSDTETWSSLEVFDFRCLPLRIVKVTVPGQVAALNKGLETAKGDIISITDDDAVPHTDWLARIETYFLLDERIGGVGGRDYIYIEKHQLVDGAEKIVGRVQWNGRTVGNHHLGFGKAREVDILKGANMSYRRAAITGKRFDERLRGQGSQINNDMAFSLKLRRENWKLIYDPSIAVDHYPGQRFDEDQRNKFNPIARVNIIHNQTLALLEHLSSIQRPIFILWAILIGTKGARGFIQLLRFLPSEGTLAIKKWLASMRGRYQGWVTWRQSKCQVAEKQW